MSSPKLDYYYTSGYTSTGYINKIVNWNYTWLTNQTIDCSNTVAGSDLNTTSYT